MNLMAMSVLATNFSWPIDGTIVGIYLIVTMIAGLAVRKYVGKAEDFLVAGREMKVYLGIASLAATEFGIITCMYTAQGGYTQGFAGAFPGIAQFLAMLLIGLTGFCVKPLRDSGAMTIPELFEKRFGKNIRWLAGVVIVLGGLLNMGVFLKIGGQFLIACTDLTFGGMDQYYAIMLMMGILLLMVCVYTILGGMLSVLVTDFLQFVVMSAGLLVVTVLILKNIGWEKLVDTVQINHGDAGFNPFSNSGGWSYIVFQLMIQTAATLTWQTTIARLLAAKDTKTGQKVYTRTSFFFVCRWLIPGLWGIAALATIGWKPTADLNKTELDQLNSISPTLVTRIETSKIGSPTQAVTQEEISQIPNTALTKINDASINAMPKFLGTFLPIGLMGILVAAMLAADMSTDSSYMLGWASVIFNDIISPFRKKKMSDKQAILWSRCIVALIGIYLFVFGLVYTPSGNVWEYLSLTGTVYLSSMSVLLIACCYWKHANNWGAAGAIVLGTIFPMLYLTMQKIPSLAKTAENIGPNYSGIAAFVAATAGMIVGSLIKPRSANV